MKQNVKGVKNKMMETLPMPEESIREDAERMYASAIMAIERRDYQRAEDLGREAMQIYETLGIETLEDAVAVHDRIGTVSIPELMHEGVVRARLGLYGIRL